MVRVVVPPVLVPGYHTIRWVPAGRYGTAGTSSTTAGTTGTYWYLRLLDGTCSYVCTVHVRRYEQDQKLLHIITVLYSMYIGPYLD